MHPSLARSAKNATKLHAVKAADLKRFLAARPKRESAWLQKAGFSAKDGELFLVPDAKGGVASAVLGLGKGSDRLALAAFSENLPQGTYALGDIPEGFGGAQGALAWALGTYSFTRYRKSGREFPKLVVPAGVD